MTGDDVPDVVALDGSGALSVFENRGFVQVASSSVTATTTLLDFGQQTIRRESAAQTVKLTNTGNVNLSLQLSAMTDFSESDNCGHELRVGAACMVTFSFTPHLIGPQSATVQIASGLSAAFMLKGVGLDIIASGARPSRDTRPVPPTTAPATTAKSVAPALAATNAPKQPRISPRKKSLPRKLSLYHTTW